MIDEVEASKMALIDIEIPPGCAPGDLLRYNPKTAVIQVFRKMSNEEVLAPPAEPMMVPMPRPGWDDIPLKRTPPQQIPLPAKEPRHVRNRRTSVVRVAHQLKLLGRIESHPGQYIDQLTAWMFGPGKPTTVERGYVAYDLKEMREAGAIRKEDGKYYIVRP